MIFSNNLQNINNILEKIWGNVNFSESFTMFKIKMSRKILHNIKMIIDTAAINSEDYNLL